MRATSPDSVWPFQTTARLYQERRVAGARTVVSLPPGGGTGTVAAGDTARWIVAMSEAAAGPSARYCKGQAIRLRPETRHHPPPEVGAPAGVSTSTREGTDAASCVRGDHPEDHNALALQRHAQQQRWQQRLSIRTRCRTKMIRFRWRYRQQPAVASPAPLMMVPASQFFKAARPGGVSPLFCHQKAQGDGQLSCSFSLAVPLSWIVPVRAAAGSGDGVTWCGSSANDSVFDEPGS